MKLIKRGRYYIGYDTFEKFAIDKELNKYEYTLDYDFYIDETTVTNEEFLNFVQTTNYLTEAEKKGNSFVFSYYLDEDSKKKSPHLIELPWWHLVEGANWKHPEGPKTDIHTRLKHPVVHITYNDAVAYCKWANKRLPSEEEWIIAAKGGKDVNMYPWEGEIIFEEIYKCNIWTGDFPTENDGKDGYESTAPARFYDPNGYGLYQVIGNVWELTCTPKEDDKTFAKKGNVLWERFSNTHQKGNFIAKGGSFLCANSYCRRYRINSRDIVHTLTSANNIGFRCVRDTQ